jgi:hypothetical protein
MSLRADSVGHMMHNFGACYSSAQMTVPSANAHGFRAGQIAADPCQSSADEPTVSVK